MTLAAATRNRKALQDVRAARSARRARASPARCRRRSASSSTRCRAPSRCATRASISPRRWSRRSKSAATSTISTGSTTTDCSSCSATCRGRACRRASSWPSARRFARARCCATAAPTSATLLAQMNAEVSRDNPAALFVTAFAGVLDLHTGELDVLQRRPGKSVARVAGSAGIARLIDGDGPPLCVVDDFDLSAGRIADGDRRHAVHRQRWRHRGGRWRTASSTVAARVERTLASAHTARAAVDRACAATSRVRRRRRAIGRHDRARAAVARRDRMTDVDACALANDDFDAPVARLRDAVRRRHQQLALAAPDRDDSARRDAAADQRSCE